MAHIDPNDLNGDVTSSSQMFKDGHEGLLSTNFDAKPEKITTCNETYAGMRPTEPGRGKYLHDI